MVNNELSKSLIDWSKWIIGINFGAATGCIIAFDEKSLTLTLLGGLPFKLAILFFSLNVLVSIIFTFYLILQTLPERYCRIVGKFQICLFTLGLIALSVWIVNKPVKPEIKEEAIKVITKEKTAEIKLINKPVEITVKL